jgi:hypothetical protein
MKDHYSEADLLETYYTQPGESMPVMMHLADCAACAARYERLERKMRSLGSCETEKPETFWARQRMLVMRRIEANRRHSSLSRAARVAAAAVFVFVLGSLVLVNMDRVADAPPVQRVDSTAPAAAAPAVVEDVPADPWQSDELKDFQSMVAWESWVDSNPRSGDQS